MSPALAPSVQRLTVIDLLRGLALFGVLQINIQSFTWGSGDVLGYLQAGEGGGDSLAYWLLCAFIQGKCYPVLGLLFGYGMAQQWQGWTRDGPHAFCSPRSRLLRRCLALGLLGLAHGCLLYFGDVLLAYAVCAAILGLALGQKTRLWIALARACAVGALLSLLAPVFLAPLLAQASTAAPAPLPWGLVEVHRIYTEDGWRAQLVQRLDDEFWQQVGSIPDFWPQVLCFMTLGIVAQRQGWLRRPSRHPSIFLRAWKLGLGVGLPCALLGASLGLYQARTQPGQEWPWLDVIQGLGSFLSCGYVAWIVQAAPRMANSLRLGPLMDALAASGRLSLTHYVTQSLIMGAVLSGWGLGLGSHASHVQLAALGALIYLLQVILGRAWLRHHRQGPLEYLWRRCYEVRAPAGG